MLKAEGSKVKAESSVIWSPEISSRLNAERSSKLIEDDIRIDAIIL
jgi:hypothetical protein